MPSVVAKSVAMLSDMATVRPALPTDLTACLDIIRLFPDFFTPDVVDTVDREFSVHDCWVITEAGPVIGFAIVSKRTSLAAEVLWAAVHPAHQQRGYGSSLIGYVLDSLLRHGVHLVEAKTLDRSADYEPYEATNAFWERMGFVQVDSIDPLPGWQPGNPAAIYVAGLRSTIGNHPTLGDHKGD